MRPLDELIRSLSAQVPSMHALMEQLVLVNSYSRNVEGANACGAMLRDAFEMKGLALHVERGGPDSGDHFFWSTPSGASTKPILLIGHHDTVFPPGDFEGYRVAGGRGHGPGCFDMKGSLALICGVLRTLSDAELLERSPLVIASVADEEIGSLDSKPHLEAWARRASCALVFESGRTRDEIVTRRRGVGTVRANAIGRAAHAGNAHADGANAIWALSRFVDAAQNLTDYARGLTVNVGLIDGGTSSNTVAERASATIDLRFESVTDAQTLMAALHDAAGQLCVPGTHIELEGGVKRMPMEKTAASDALFREYAACQRAAGLGDGEHPLVGGGSDANTVAAAGCPVIDGLGPRGRGFHTHEECVELDSFAPKAEALLRFLYGRMGEHS